MTDTNPSVHSIDPTEKKLKQETMHHAIWFLLVVVIVAVFGFGLLKGAWQQMTRSKYYQAVHLTNGQIFFGKLQAWNHKEVLLTQVYYLQTTEAATDNKNANTNTSSQFSLVKLGNELHGPLNRIYINKSQIVYTEDLKNDSQVTKAILGNK
ncbi:MAG: hypothetical protein WCT08_01005 [Patescibacteria group bacterium]|jgi:DNA-binding transcriptional regulator of glucitol operon